MAVALPNAQFSLGTSSDTAPVASNSLVDMSLDDLIKARRKEAKKKSTSAQDRKKEGTQKRRNAVKGKAGSDNRKPTAVQKSLGKTQAKRNANLSARRGLTGSNKPSAMEVEKEVYRQQRRVNNVRQQQQGPPPRRSLRRQRGGGKTEADRKVKVKMTTEKKKSIKAKQQVTGPPPKKAVNAAVAAMTNAGYQVPKDMKLVISFVPNATNSAKHNKGQVPQRNKQQQKGGNQRKKFDR